MKRLLFVGLALLLVFTTLPVTSPRAAAQGDPPEMPACAAAAEAAGATVTLWDEEAGTWEITWDFATGTQGFVFDADYDWTDDPAWTEMLSWDDEAFGHYGLLVDSATPSYTSLNGVFEFGASCTVLSFYVLWSQNFVSAAYQRAVTFHNAPGGPEDAVWNYQLTGGVTGWEELSISPPEGPIVANAVQLTYAPHATNYAMVDTFALYVQGEPTEDDPNFSYIHPLSPPDRQVIDNIWSTGAWSEAVFEHGFAVNSYAYAPWAQDDVYGADDDLRFALSSMNEYTMMYRANSEAAPVHSPGPGVIVSITSVDDTMCNLTGEPFLSMGMDAIINALNLAWGDTLASVAEFLFGSSDYCHPRMSQALFIVRDGGDIQYKEDWLFGDPVPDNWEQAYLLPLGQIVEIYSYETGHTLFYWVWGASDYVNVGQTVSEGCIIGVTMPVFMDELSLTSLLNDYVASVGFVWVENEGAPIDDNSKFRVDPESAIACNAPTFGNCINDNPAFGEDVSGEIESWDFPYWSGRTGDLHPGQRDDGLLLLTNGLSVPFDTVVLPDASAQYSVKLVVSNIVTETDVILTVGDTDYPLTIPAGESYEFTSDLRTYSDEDYGDGVVDLSIAMDGEQYHDLVVDYLCLDDSADAVTPPTTCMIGDYDFSDPAAWGITAGTPGGGSTLLNDLAAWWTLDDTAWSDSAGSSDLTASGTVTASPGLIDNAASNNGSSYLYASDNAALSQAGAFTLAGWFYLDSLSDAGLVSKYNPGSEQREYQLAYISGSGLRFWVGTGGTSSYVTSTVSITSGAWYFVVAWHDPDADTINIQVNGGAIESTSHSAGVLDGTASLALGAGNSGGTWYLTGDLDNWGLWSRSLTTAERADLYNSGAGLAYPFGTDGPDDAASGGGLILNPGGSANQTIDLPPALYDVTITARSLPMLVPPIGGSYDAQINYVVNDDESNPRIDGTFTYTTTEFESQSEHWDILTGQVQPGELILTNTGSDTVQVDSICFTPLTGPWAGEWDEASTCNECTAYYLGDARLDAIESTRWLACRIEAIYECDWRQSVIDTRDGVDETVRGIGMLGRWLSITINKGVQFALAGYRYLAGYMNNTGLAVTDSVNWMTGAGTVIVEGQSMGLWDVLGLLINSVANVLTTAINDLVSLVHMLLSFLTPLVGGLLGAVQTVLGMLESAVDELLSQVDIIYQIVGALLDAVNNADPATVPGAPNCGDFGSGGDYHPLCWGGYILDNTIFSGPAAMWIPILTGALAFNLMLWGVRKLRETVEAIG